MDRNAAYAARVATSLGLPSGPVAWPDIPGNANHVVILGEAAERVVVRVPRDPNASDGFTVEAWCMRRAAERGIPVPQTVAVGRFEGIPYMVQRFVPGANRDRLSRATLWEALGGYAKTIGTIPLGADAPAGLFGRFGRDLRAAWHAHLDYNLAALSDSDPLVSLGVYTLRQRARLRKMIEGLEGIPMEFGLSHGDLSIRNLRPDSRQGIVLIDWGSASAGPLPYTDLQHLLKFHFETGVPSAADLRSFARGYGQQPAPMTVQRVRTLGALDLVRWALDRRPDRVAEMATAARTLVDQLPG